MENRKGAVISTVKWLGYDIVGAFIYAAGVHCFTSAHHIAPGGVTGISIIINYLTGIPIGILVLLINIPLLLIGLKFLGRRFAIRTLTSVAILTFFLDYVVVKLPVYTGNTLLASLFGGVVMGAGLAIVFMGGSTTGGTDIVTKLLLQKHPYLQMGRIIFIIDLIIISASTIVYKSLDSALYAIIAMFTTARVIDALLYGLDVGKLVLVISEKSDEIAQRIIHDLDRGVTLLKAAGGYSGKQQNVIMCAVRNSEYVKLKQLAHSIDPKSFVIVTSTSEVRGEGFKPIKEEN